MEPSHDALSVRRRCELLGLNRSSYYYELATESSENLQMMRLIDKQYLQTPFFGSRQMAAWLERLLRKPVNRKYTQRLMRIMRIEAIYPRQRTTLRNLEHRVFPYLLFIAKFGDHTQGSGMEYRHQLHPAS